MSRRARRAWTAGLICVAAAGVGLVAFVVWQTSARAAKGQDSSGTSTPAASSEPASSGQAATAGLDPVTYGRVTELRERLRLTDESMAPMGCDGPAAEAVLGRALGWYQANAATWDSRRSAVTAATGQLRQALGRMHAGPVAAATASGAGGAGGSSPTVESLIADVQAAQAAVSAAVTAENDLLAAAAEHVGGGMSDAQRAQWAAIRANPADGGEHSLLPGITKAQLTALAQARTRQARLQAAANTPAARSTAAGDPASPIGYAGQDWFARAEPTILTPAQAQSLAATRDALRRNLSAVQAASAKVLSPPPRPAGTIDRPLVQQPQSKEMGLTLMFSAKMPSDLLGDSAK